METFYLNDVETKGYLNVNNTVRIPASSKVKLRYEEFLVGYYKAGSFVVCYRVDSYDSAIQQSKRVSKDYPFSPVILKLQLNVSRL